MRATNGRHSPSNGLPYTRVLAAFMLATLISTIFALPAIAAAGDLEVTVSGPAGPILPGAAATYTVAVFNNSGATSTAATLTNTLTNGAYVGTPTNNGTGTGCAVPAGRYHALRPVATSRTRRRSRVTINVTAGDAPADMVDAVSLVGDLDGAPRVRHAQHQHDRAERRPCGHEDAAPASRTPGGDVTYTITVNNNGPSAATVSRSPTRPAAGVTFGAVNVLSSDAVVYVVPRGRTGRRLGHVRSGVSPNGTTVTITITATLAADRRAGPVNNTVTATSTSSDATTPNNAATDSFTVGAARSTSASASRSTPTTAAPGDTVTYTVTVHQPQHDHRRHRRRRDRRAAGGPHGVTPPTAPTAGTAARRGNTWTWTIPTRRQGRGSGDLDRRHRDVRRDGATMAR